jgi:selenocysteine-specific translation elongation factor
MVLAFNKETKVFELISTQEKEPPMERDESALAVLQAIDTMIEQENLTIPNTSTSNGNGISLMCEHLESMARKDVKAAVDRLFKQKAITVTEYQKTNRHVGMKIVLTDTGKAMLVREVEDDDEGAERAQRPKGGKGVDHPDAAGTTPSYLD